TSIPTKSAAESCSSSQRSDGFEPDMRVTCARRSSGRWRPVVFAHAQLAHRQLVHFERLKTRLLDCYPADGEPAARQPADGNGSEGSRADGKRVDGGGGNGFGSPNDSSRHRWSPPGSWFSPSAG